MSTNTRSDDTAPVDPDEPGSGGGGNGENGEPSPTNPAWPWWVILIVAAVVVVFWWVTMLLVADPIKWTDGERFALGVGGTAIIAFVFGVGRFSTVRAAAALPVVILLIGAATWPQAAEFLPEDIRKEVIQWTGVILGATAVAEAGKQAATAAAGAASGGFQGFGAGDEAAPVADPPGDLGRR